MPMERWEIDHMRSSIQFSVRNLMLANVHGRFTNWAGELYLDDKNPGRSHVDVRIDAGSIQTGDPDLDRHLRSAEFLDAARSGYIVYESTSVDRLAGGRLHVSGFLTIRGTTRPVALEVELAGRDKDSLGGERAAFIARASIDRKDFGLNWNLALENGGMLVGDRIGIRIEVETVRTSAWTGARAVA